MILYHLQCESGHQFEAWFRDSGAYDSQCVNGYVECPFCGDYHVSETPPAVVPDAPAVVDDRDPGGSTRAQIVADQILNAVEKLREPVLDPIEEDGDDLLRESHRIDYGEADDHIPYGEAAEDAPEDRDDDSGGYFRLRSVFRQDD